MEIGHAVFVAKPETIHHLFFECSYAKFLWRAVHMILGINPPLHVSHLFNTCYAMSDNTFRSFFVRHNSLLLSIWLIRNEEVLDKCRPKSLLQVLFRGTHWLRFWAQLQRCEVQQSIIIEACRKLENATM